MELNGETCVSSADRVIAQKSLFKLGQYIQAESSVQKDLNSQSLRVKGISAPAVQFRRS